MPPPGLAAHIIQQRCGVWKLVACCVYYMKDRDRSWKIGAGGLFCAFRCSCSQRRPHPKITSSSYF